MTNTTTSSAVEVMGSARDSDRVDRLSETLRDLESREVGAFALHLLQETVRLWRDVIHDGQRFAVTDKHRQAIAQAETTSLVSHMDQATIDDVINTLSTGNVNDDDEVRQIVHTSLMHLDEQLRNVAFTPLSIGPPSVFDSSGVPLATRELATAWQSRARNLRETLNGLKRFNHLEAKTREALARVGDVENDITVATQELSEVQSQVKKAKAEVAQYQLASQFEKLSESERWTTWVFRVVTFALLIIAVVIAAFLNSSDEWSDVLAHLAVVVGIGSAAAYTARLASTHGATADWAKSLQVQLLTFRDFLGVIEEPEVKHRVYEEFGRRVLGAPPGKGEEAGAALPTSQLVELANVIAGARKNSAGSN